MRRNFDRIYQPTSFDATEYVHVRPRNPVLNRLVTGQAALKPEYIVENDHILHLKYGRVLEPLTEADADTWGRSARRCLVQAAKVVEMCGRYSVQALTHSFRAHILPHHFRWLTQRSPVDTLERCWSEAPPFNVAA